MIEFVLQHGYIVLFVWVLLDQIGIPIPVAPLLLTAGALAGAGKVDPFFALGLSSLATVLGDLIWYEAGRRRGRSMLNLLCRVSLEPGSCVTRTRSAFAEYGIWTMLVAKFIPGLNAIAVCLAGTMRMSRLKFSLVSAIGAAIWAGTGIGLGYAFSEELEAMIRNAADLGTSFLAIVAALGILLVFKYIRRRRFLQQLRVLRITPEELKQRIDGGEDLVILDLRTATEYQKEPRTLPRAIHIAPRDLRKRHKEIPEGREIILYCSCPDEATSSRVALQLQRVGIGRIRSLSGGLNAWSQRGYPLTRENVS